MAHRIGVDLGGTKIEAVVLDPDGTSVVRRRVPTPQGLYEETVAAIAELVRDVESQAGISAEQQPVGIGTPGSVSPATGRIQNSNSLCLIDQPLREDLERTLDRPVRLANDADCFSLSEAVDGAAAGAASVFGVIVGTGTGGGVVVHGRLLQGPNAIAGEWGHNPLPWPDGAELRPAACYCGRSGCIETYLSGPGMVRDYQMETGLNSSPEEIVRDAERGVSKAVDAMNRYEDRFARALASVINVLDPEVVVLGGGMSNIASLYEAVPGRWDRYIFSQNVETRLVKAVHGDSSGVRGAAWLWPEGG
ncbi:MAG: ROK family protein [Magnetococcales bacterium]|nr:ROK family protein [Magnetococcales bacterium]